MEPFLGQIMLFGGNFAPRGWALCHGQLLPISQYSALFSLLGTTYGGDGRTTFGLPDLRGRAPIGVGHGAGLSTITWGERGGAETHRLSVTEMPSHDHSGSTLTGTVGCNEEDGDKEEAAGNTFGNTSANPYNSNAVDNHMSSVSISGSTGKSGGSTPFNIRNPYIGITYVIALQGIYPSRS